MYANPVRPLALDARSYWFESNHRDYKLNHYCFKGELKLDDSIFNELYQKYLNNTIQWADEAERYGFENPEQARSAFKRERIRRGIPSKEDASSTSQSSQENVPEQERMEYRESDESIHTICDSKRIRTKQDVIEQFGVDTKTWKVKEFTIRTSEGYRKDRKVDWHVRDGETTQGDVEDSGKMLIVPLVHTETVFVRRTPDDITPEELVKIFNNLKFNAKAKVVRPLRYSERGLVLEIDLADIHVGNLPVDEGTSISDRVSFVIEDIINRVEDRGINLREIYFVQLGDILHYDTMKRTTTGGTQLTSKGDNATIFDESAKIMISAIDRLRTLAPVVVIGIYGNHDRISSYMLMKALEFYYRDVEDVEIDAGHSPRKFRKFGENLVFWEHGDVPLKNAMSLPLKEARKELGQSSFVEIHSGNFHHEKTIEKDGMIIRYVSSPAQTDEWHNEKAYVGAIHKVMSFVWDLNEGLRDTWYSKVD